MSLDEKLKNIQITRESRVNGLKIIFDYVLTVDEVAQIKQAFADEGYQKPDELGSIAYSSMLVDGVVNIVPKQRNLMTGKEWINIYNKKLKQIIEVEYGTEVEPPEIPRWLINQAAHRASGIKETE